VQQLCFVLKGGRRSHCAECRGFLRLSHSFGDVSSTLVIVSGIDSILWADDTFYCAILLCNYHM